MISKTKIAKRTKKKTKPEIVETINLAKKNNLLKVAKKLSSPIKLHTKINVGDLADLKSSKILVIGKVLGSGEITQKLTIAALDFSKDAREKLKEKGCTIMTIKKAIDQDSKLKDFKII
ncbi:hypothetical protein GOV14_02305 [Candidatus Pacearchaeota archaeon]|nr:hypothetical protein [Candidatus Pacearchaeota archaeon]